MATIISVNTTHSTENKEGSEHDRLLDIGPGKSWILILLLLERHEIPPILSDLTAPASQPMSTLPRQHGSCPGPPPPHPALLRLSLSPPPILPHPSLPALPLTSPPSPTLTFALLS